MKLSSISNQSHGLMIVLISISENILQEAEASCRCSREFRASLSLKAGMDLLEAPIHWIVLGV